MQLIQIGLLAHIYPSFHWTLYQLTIAAFAMQLYSFDLTILGSRDRKDIHQVKWFLSVQQLAAFWMKLFRKVYLLHSSVLYKVHKKGGMLTHVNHLPAHTFQCGLWRPVPYVTAAVENGLNWWDLGWETWEKGHVFFYMCMQSYEICVDG